MIRKNEKKKFSDCKNIEQKSIPWLELRLKHTMSEKVMGIVALHGPSGFGLYIRMILIFAECFDYWNPGALKIRYQHFREMLSPFFRRRETILKYLEILNKLRLVFSWREGGDIILYCPYVEKATEYFVKKRKRDIVENPSIAGDLLARCKLEIKGELL